MVTACPPVGGGGPDVLFQLKVAANRGGVLGLLWMRENGNWRIVSYPPLANFAGGHAVTGGLEHQLLDGLISESSEPPTSLR